MPKSFDRLVPAISLAGIVFLAFIAGAACVYYKLPPYQWIDATFRSDH